MIDREFSKKCGKCRQRTVALAAVPYAVQIDHDGRKYHVDLPDLVVPKCANCGEIFIDEAADQKISDAFRLQAGLLTPKQIRAGRQDFLGLTQQQFADMLGVAVSTLSRWENGVQIQQKSLDRFMRVVFSNEDVRAALSDDAVLAGLGVNPAIESQGLEAR